MNKQQKVIAIITAAVLLGMLLYPPCLMKYKEVTTNQGYNFLFSVVKSTEGEVNFRIVDTSLLALQIAVVVLVGGILWFVVKDKN